MTFSENEYIISIKEKLNNYVDEYIKKTGKTLNNIHKDLEKKGFTFTYNTIKNTLDIGKLTLNTLVIVELCEYCNIDINEIFSKNNNHNNSDFLIPNEENFIPLMDPKYAGTYYCYFFRPVQFETGLDKGILTINIDDNSSDVKFELKISRKNIDNEEIQISKFFYGVPYLSKKFNNILIFLTSPIGEYYFMTIDYKYYVNLGMYFRIGSFCTYNSENDHPPLFEKIVLCRKELSDENRDYIYGLLNLNNEKIMIKRNHLENLCNQNDLINKFFQTFKNILENQLHNCYIFGEKQILEFFNLNSTDIDMNKEDIIRAILILRKHSLSPERITVKDLDEIPHIIKHL